jgi:hypothetical protein
MPEEAAAAPPPVSVQIAHTTDGRARLRLTRRISRERLEDLCENIAALPGVTRTLARPNTGSIIVEARLKKAALSTLLKDCDALKIRPPLPHPPLGAALRFGLLRTDEEILKKTHGEFSLHTALGALLLIAAVIQLGRGRIVGPAATLLINALALLENAGPKER